MSAEKIASKVSRIQSELLFLIQGAGSIEARAAAVADLTAFAQTKLAEQAAAEAAPVEQPAE